MQTGSPTAPVSKGMLWTGIILRALVGVFFTLDGIGKMAKVAPAVEGTVKFGYPVSSIVPLGFVLLFCTALYRIPPTSVLGAILLTGYLGGAVATHLRASGTLFEIVFPVILGIIVWGGLYARDERVRALIPWQR